jgi:hypothetical protein
MATAKGVLQGSTGVAAGDEKHQVMVEAQAHGTGSEQALLGPVVAATARLRTPAPVMTADAGDHAEDTRRALAGAMGAASSCDHGSRLRAAGDAGPAQHQATPDALWDKRPQEKRPKRCGPAAFRVAEDGSHGPCPAGQRLSSHRSHGPFHGDATRTFRGAERDGVPGTRRGQGLRTPEQMKTRQVAVCQGQREGGESHTGRLQAVESRQGGGAGEASGLTHPIAQLASHGDGR